jgi:hypothetical protein
MENPVFHRDNIRFQDVTWLWSVGENSFSKLS